MMMKKSILIGLNKARYRLSKNIRIGVRSAGPQLLLLYSNLKSRFRILPNQCLFQCSKLWIALNSIITIVIEVELATVDGKKIFVNFQESMGTRLSKTIPTVSLFGMKNRLMNRIVKQTKVKLSLVPDKTDV